MLSISFKLEQSCHFHLYTSARSQMLQVSFFDKQKKKKENGRLQLFCYQRLNNLKVSVCARSIDLRDIIIILLISFSWSVLQVTNFPFFSR